MGNGGYWWVWRGDSQGSLSGDWEVIHKKMFVLEVGRSFFELVGLRPLRLITQQVCEVDKHFMLVLHFLHFRFPFLLIPAVGREWPGLVGWLAGRMETTELLEENTYGGHVWVCGVARKKPVSGER